MNIWIDLTNSPHVVFFSEMIRELRDEHNVILTCRPLSNTIELLDMLGHDYTVVGRHYGAGSIGKLLGFFVRIWQLLRFLRGRGIDVAISHSSFYSPPAARLAGIPSLYLNDNEHAAGNWISFLFADVVMIPEHLEQIAASRKWHRLARVVLYPGVKEGIYLREPQAPPPAPPEFNDSLGRKRIVIRPEPWSAQYYRGGRNFLDDLLLTLGGRYRILLLPRGETQRKHYAQEKFSDITVLDRTIRLAEIVGNCDLFIGAGGTMTREAAVLGIPTISIYQDELLSVDTYLIKKGDMVHKKELKPEFVDEMLGKDGRDGPDSFLLNEGRKAYALIKTELMSLCRGK